MGPAEAEAGRRCRLIPVEEMAEAAGGFVRAGRPALPGGASSHDRVTPTGQKCRSILAPVVVEGGPSVLVPETKPVSLLYDPPGRAGAHYQRTLLANAKKASFFKQVYRVAGTIPPGRVLTYGQIATLLGTPYQARQVGWAMHGCPPGLPWHRVVGAGGRLLHPFSQPAGGCPAAASSPGTGGSPVYR